jgi:hypothetical protein
VFIELYRQGEIASAVRAFRDIYGEIADAMIDTLELPSI